MKKKFSKSLFIFRRDLRLIDNRGLIHALEFSEKVLACFIFDPRQVESQNKYRSLNCIQFMIQSIEELSDALSKKKSVLHLFFGKPEDVVAQLIARENIDSVVFNYDYTPFSRARDAALENLCNKANIAFNGFHDALLNDPTTIKTKAGTPYTIFTPYYRNARTIPVAELCINNHSNYVKKIEPNQYNITFDFVKRQEWGSYHNPRLYKRGGRLEALAILKSLALLNNYSKTRNVPSHATTGLSAHNKFGTVSIREVYQAFAQHNNHELIRQLYWRDFFTQISYHFPDNFGHAFHKKYETLSWDNNLELFNSWCTGLTGFPIVDAGMRQLITTGYMHNRVRLLVASLLTKDLHIDWRWGERYFAQQLVDYDPAVNNGNWQWAASTGCDAQPYFRIFNPWLQQKKFDPECIYIKQWIPELKNASTKMIHTWYAQKSSVIEYPFPIVNHSVESKKAKKIYRSLSYE